MKMVRTNEDGKMKRSHDWKAILRKYIGSGICSGVLGKVRVVHGNPGGGRYAELQQESNGYIGLQIKLPKPYNPM